MKESELNLDKKIQEVQQYNQEMLSKMQQLNDFVDARLAQLQNPSIEETKIEEPIDENHEVTFLKKLF